MPFRPRPSAGGLLLVGAAALLISTSCTRGSGSVSASPTTTAIAASTAAATTAATAVQPLATPARAASPAAVGTPSSSGPRQAPALPGAQGIASGDRVYTADQSSNTVTVIDPARNVVLGTIPLGSQRLDGVLGPLVRNEVNVHGLGFSRDGRRLVVVSVSSNAVQVIDTATNRVISTTYVGRSPHEAFVSPDGKEVWVAVRGEGYVSVVDAERGGEIARIPTADEPSKVVFSPDGRTAYVNSFKEEKLDVVDVASRKVTQVVNLPAGVGASADEAMSPDGLEVWLGHPLTGKTTVVDTRRGSVKAVLDSGPRTNHPNFVTTAAGAFAWVTVGGEDVIKVYRRGDGAPVMDGTPIATSGKAPHGIWPSPDNSRIYVALQKSDAVDVIDTATRKIITTLHVGNDPQALVYVARAEPGADAPSQQALNGRVENFPVQTNVPSAKGNVTVRTVQGLDEVDLTVRGLQPKSVYDVYLRGGGATVKLLSVRSDDQGTVPQVLAYLDIFANGYDAFVLVPSGQTP